MWPLILVGNSDLKVRRGGGGMNERHPLRSPEGRDKKAVSFARIYTFFVTVTSQIACKCAYSHQQPKWQRKNLSHIYEYIYSCVCVYTYMLLCIYSAKCVLLACLATVFCIVDVAPNPAVMHALNFYIEISFFSLNTGYFTAERSGVKFPVYRILSH